MDKTSIDVIAAAVEQSAVAPLGEFSSPDGTLTLLFCEVANIGAIRAALSPERVSAMLADQRLIVQRVAARHRAEIAREHEDGFMIVFDSAHAALRCAIELQRTFSPVIAEEAGDVPELRIGLHTGTVIATGEDLYGRNVLLAARIAGVAQGREIVVSDKLKEYTQGDPGFRFTERGEHHFKGLHGEHELFAALWQQPDERPAS